MTIPTFPVLVKNIGAAALLTVILLSCSGERSGKSPCTGLGSVPEGNGKKVYADYHGVRYPRQHDGKLGRWEMYADTRQSATGRKTLCYNADLIDSAGRHLIAAQAYPQVGMQSNLDEDYIEYQILSAKTAGIDGFFIEWGYFPHENDVLLKAMQKAAGKYGFEIGVNWCDGWLYYDWITKIFPEIDTREEKTDYMAGCWQYLVDSVFNVPTAPLVDGRPVFYHFGPGAATEEFSKVLSQAVYPEHMKTPAGLRRWADWGHLENGKYIPVTYSSDIEAWKALGEIPTAWLPARVRTMDAEHPYWDNYATADDLTEFMKPFRDSIWLDSDPRFMVKSGFAMPGMDNRGCAGWGRGHFFYIPRNGGATYEDMWRFCMESRDSLDMMFIASWSDYTEGHEIEPTVENGDRELRTTLRYASAFKETDCDSSGLGLPLRLFERRKSEKFLEKCVAAVGENADIHGKKLSGIRTMALRVAAILDEAAVRIASGRYGRAEKLLGRAEKKLTSLHGFFVPETVKPDDLEISASGSGFSVTLPEALLKKLRSCHYKGYVEFDYLDEGREYLFVRSSTEREPADRFNVVGKLRTDGSGEWKHAKMELYPENIIYRDGAPAFYFSDGVRVRDIAVEYEIYNMSPADSWN